MYGAALPDTAAFIINGIDQGLRYLHDHHILHRDLHKCNVLVNISRGLQPGEEPTEAHMRGVCICDMGQACDVRGDAPGAKHTCERGALPCVPPEIYFLKSATARYHKPVDVWAVGVIFVQLLAGSAVANIGKVASYKDHARDILKVAGPVAKTIAAKLGWSGLQPGLVADKPSCPAFFYAAITGSTKAHGAIMIYDPSGRPTAGNIHKAITTKYKLA